MWRQWVGGSVGRWAGGSVSQKDSRPAVANGLNTAWGLNTAAPKRVGCTGCMHAATDRPTDRPIHPPTHRPTHPPTWPRSQTAVRIERDLNIIDSASGPFMVEHVVRVKPYQEHRPDGHAEHAEHHHHSDEPPRTAAQRLRPRRHGADGCVLLRRRSIVVRTVQPPAHAEKNRGSVDPGGWTTPPRHPCLRAVHGTRGIVIRRVSWEE